MLDEQALRRPEFEAGEPIVLSDGQTWHFPPIRRDHFYFRRDANGRTRAASATTFGDDFDTLVDRFVETDDALGESLALAELAYALLARNYTVEWADTRHILRRFPADDPRSDANLEMWAAIADVAMGNNRPKPTAVG